MFPSGQAENFLSFVRRSMRPRSALKARLLQEGAAMATIFSGKDNLWREFLNPLRGLTMERIVQLVEQGERGAFADFM